MPPRGVRSWGLSGIFAAHMSDTARLTCRHQKRDAKKGGGDSENSGSSQRVPLGKLPAKSRANKNRSPVSQAARECVPVDKTCQQPRPHPHIYIYMIHKHKSASTQAVANEISFFTNLHWIRFLQFVDIVQKSYVF